MEDNPDIQCGCPEHNNPNGTMIYLNGSKNSFRCECGANVFTQINALRYRCNGCKAIYTGNK